MANVDSSRPLLARRGPPLFICSGCQLPLSASDLADLGLRVPEPGETVEEYCDAELLDPGEIRHRQCVRREAERV